MTNVAPNATAAKSEASADTKQVDTKQVDTKQVDTKQADTKQADTKQADTKQADTKQADTKQIVLKDIGAKWDKFSAQDLSALKGKDDLVTQVVAKYGLEKGQAQRDVDTVLKGRQI